MEHLSIKVYGKVQGVYFRKHTREKANELGVKGWVKNEDDGTVEIAAEGEKPVLEEFLKWCYIGPEGALVKRVDFSWGDMKGYNDFEFIDEFA